MVHLPLFSGGISKNEVLSKELFLVLEERMEYNQDRKYKTLFENCEGKEYL